MNLPLRRFIGTSLLAAVSIVGAAHAQSTYPSRPITIVVPYQAGGGADTVARLLAPHMAKHLNGQSIIVDNRIGAAGNIGVAYAARAKPDGYTLLVTNSATTINASLGMAQGYDVRKDLAPIALLVSSPVAIGVNSALLPVRDIAELVAHIKRHPGQLNYASCGNGSPQHFVAESFKQLAGLDLAHVPYNGCAPAIVGGLGDQVQVLFSTIPNMAPHLKNGKLRMLGAVSSKRVSFMPDLPASTETPAFKDLDMPVWFAMFAPAGTPKDIRAKLEQAALSALRDNPALRSDFESRYYEVDAQGADSLARQVDKDLEMYTRLAKQANIQLK